MPYKSDAQRKWMHENHPEIAKKWDKEFPNQKGLPKRAAASDNAAFDVHSVDPRRLKEEVKKDLNLKSKKHKA